ncbi:MAG: DNA-methyltransferase [Caldilineaceae bacterium]
MSEIVTIGQATLYHGDCREILPTLGPVDSIVTDPPYGLSFMGNHWDYDVPTAEVWKSAITILKPGGHLLAFAGTRTQHRMACAIEDAGFDIRDMIAWVYGSGFPKSHNVSKAIDKAAGAEREVVGEMPDRWTNKGSVLNFATDRAQDSISLTGGPATEAAKEWDGWGTALKPALEPITVARKPLIGTVADNVQAHGTGAMNIDGCRVPGTVTTNPLVRNAAGFQSAGLESQGETGAGTTSEGRFPANFIHDGSAEVVDLFPFNANAPTARAGGFRHEGAAKGSVDFKQGAQATLPVVRGDAGSAARFFYTAKADRNDRGDGNTHPTVKPTDLMVYLCRLVTRPGGLVLDPYLGSGTTGVACGREGFAFIGIERERKYFDIACERIERAYAQQRLFA